MDVGVGGGFKISDKEMDALVWECGGAAAARFRLVVDPGCLNRTFPAPLIFGLGRGVCTWGWATLGTTTGSTDGGRSSGDCTWAGMVSLLFLVVATSGLRSGVLTRTLLLPDRGRLCGVPPGALVCREVCRELRDVPCVVGEATWCCRCRCLVACKNDRSCGVGCRVAWSLDWGVWLGSGS